MMKISYTETMNDLVNRIEIHQKYGTKDIGKWMVDLLNLKGSITILDVGCGSGKQCFLFYDYLKGNCHIIGGDVSHELLANAKKESKKRGNKITFINLDFDKDFPFPSNSFDLLTCCFAIYYAKDISFTISEMFRVLKPNGRLFVTGPMPENKKVFYSIIKEATNKQIPPMPGSSRYSSKILDIIKNKFSKTEIYIFENPLIFREAEPFVDYTKASLSEDRKLWSDIFVDEGFNQIIYKIAKVAKKIVEQEGKIRMTKVVGGFIAYKPGGNYVF